MSVPSPKVTHDHRLLLASVRSRNQIAFEQSGFPHPPWGDFRGLNADVRRVLSTSFYTAFGVASVRGERVDREDTEGNAGQGPYWVAGHPPDGDTPGRAGHDPGAPTHLRPAEHEERAHDEHDSHDEIDSVVGLKAVPEDRTFEILREHP